MQYGESWLDRSEYDPQVAADPHGAAAQVAHVIDTILGFCHEALHSQATYQSELDVTHWSQTFQIDALADAPLRSARHLPVIGRTISLCQSADRKLQSVHYNVAANWLVRQAGILSPAVATEYDLMFYPRGNVQGVVTEVDMLAPDHALLERPLTTFDCRQLLHLLTELSAYQSGVVEEARHAEQAHAYFA